jgi:hypothetical protein
VPVSRFIKFVIKRRIPMYRFVIATVLVATSGWVAAQDRKPLDEVPGEKKTAVFEEQDWYVATASGGVSERKIELYAGPSKMAAQEACDKWEQANKATKPNWITNVSDPIKVRVPVRRTTTPRDKPSVQFQDPKFVDPGSTKKAAKRAPSLKGKKVEGLVGQSIVTFEFGQGNQLVISGERKGEGTWRQDDSVLRMETAVSSFWGQVDQAGGAGIRFPKSDRDKTAKNPFDQWSFRFEKEPAKETQSTPKVKPAEETKLTADSLVGTWVGGGVRLVLSRGGRGSITGTGVGGGSCSWEFDMVRFGSPTYPTLIIRRDDGYNHMMVYMKGKLRYGGVYLQKKQ